MDKPKRISLLVKLKFPEQLATIIGTLGLILIVATIFPKTDFGVIKTPELSENYWLVLIGGIILILINIPYFKNTDEQEVVAFNKSRHLHTDFRSIFSEIKNDAIFWGGNFYISVNEQKDVLLDLLMKGVKIKYFVFNPESHLCKDASIDFDEVNKNHFYDQCEITLSNLKDLEIRWKQQKQNAKTAGGSLEIRLYSNMPRLRAYILDSQDKSSYSYIVHFLFKTDSSDLPLYKIKNSNEMIQGYLNAFHKLWEDENTISFEHFLETNKIGI